jgi:hypothetical protein
MSGTDAIATLGHSLAHPMSLSAVMMAARQPPVTAFAMKTFLNSTTEQLAAVPPHFRSTMRANLPHPERLEYRRCRHVPLPVDPSRIPTCLRRRRLPLRFQSRFDAQTLKLRTPDRT